MRTITRALTRSRHFSSITKGDHGAVAPHDHHHEHHLHPYHYHRHAHPAEDAMPGVEVKHHNLVRKSGGEVAWVHTVVDEKVHTSKMELGTKVVSQDLGGDIARLTFLFRDGPVFEDLFSAGASYVMRWMLNKDSIASSEYVTKVILQQTGISLDKPSLCKRSWLAFSCEGHRDTVIQPIVFEKFWVHLLFPKFSDIQLNWYKKEMEEEFDQLKEENPKEILLDLLHTVAFRGSPLGNTQFIPEYNKKYFKSSYLFDRWTKHYGFGNIAVIATNLNHTDLISSFGNSPWVSRAHPKDGAIATPKSNYFGGEAFELHRRSLSYDDQFTNVADTWTAYAFNAPGADDVIGWAATNIIKSTLEVATGQILVNSFTRRKLDVIYESYEGAGLFGIVTPNATAAQLREFRNAIARFGELQPAELEAQKKLAVAKFLTSTDGWRGTHSTLLTTFASSGNPLDRADIAAAIKAVTVYDLRAAVSRMLSSPATLVHYGDNAAAPTLADL